MSERRSHLAEQARKHVFHRWALHLRHQAGKVEARSVLGQIVVEVRNRLVECDWKAGGVVGAVPMLASADDIAVKAPETGIAPTTVLKDEGFRIPLYLCFSPDGKELACFS